jgi:prophage regulatory protein
MNTSTQQTALKNRPSVVAIKPAYLDLEGTTSFLSLSGSTVQKMIREETFPKPRLLSGRRVGWLVRELEEWAESRPVADLPPPENTGAKKPCTR